MCDESRFARFDLHIACQIDRELPGKEKGPGQARPSKKLCVRGCCRGNRGHRGVFVNKLHGFVSQDPIFKRDHEIVLLVIILDGMEVLSG